MMQRTLDLMAKQGVCTSADAATLCLADDTAAWVCGRANTAAFASFRVRIAAFQRPCRALAHFSLKKVWRNVVAARCRATRT
uniref:Late expression factor 12 n=1 Tax=Spilarctia obliqua nucleopolyhedrovirus TaxID=1638618 RepID=A0A7G9U8E9_9ABAC|nr:late expression factor 12 [Spilarctia obliqua nucleopolyhedrovirus]